MLNKVGKPNPLFTFQDAKEFVGKLPENEFVAYHQAFDAEDGEYVLVNTGYEVTQPEAAGWMQATIKRLETLSSVVKCDPIGFDMDKKVRHPAVRFYIPISSEDVKRGLFFLVETLDLSDSLFGELDKRQFEQYVSRKISEGWAIQSVTQSNETLTVTLVDKDITI